MDVMVATCKFSWRRDVAKVIALIAPVKASSKSYVVLKSYRSRDLCGFRTPKDIYESS